MCGGKLSLHRQNRPTQTKQLLQVSSYFNVYFFIMKGNFQEREESSGHVLKVDRDNPLFVTGAVPTLYITAM